ncbi:CD83 antigen isoform X1 [Micropterus dolomieu]|uniref:CD83 antigen isoform X1 n=1 Tax=Micropterus dolomieu TaxID=147949 RepID=UPI001E8D863D|nr:CD83 antigen isoform X1 [Micropterus dolomieu]
MSPGFLHLALLLSLLCLAVGAPVQEEMPEVKSVVGADCTLQCTAKSKPGVQYSALRWYKVKEAPAPGLSGLLTQDLTTGMTRLYKGVERKVELLTESSSIFLPSVTCADRGVYSCHLAAPVGEQNQDGEVLLNVTDCADTPTENQTIPMTDAYMVIIATAVLMVALVIFIISYVSLKNTIKGKNKTTNKERLLNASLKPLEKKDLMMIYTLGPKPTMKHVCV